MENEMHKCEWCGEEYELTELRMDADLGCLCNTCIRAITSRGETLCLEY